MAQAAGLADAIASTRDLRVATELPVLLVTAETVRPGAGNTGYTPGMAKVMVSLPDDVLKAIDVEAERRGTTRSGLLRVLAEESVIRRSRRRAERMAEISETGGQIVGRGGQVAELVKANRPGH